MNRQELASQIRKVSELRGDFLLRSGVRSDRYFDKYQFESDPILLAEIARQMASLVPDGTEVLAGLELGGIPLAVMLGQTLQLPVAFIRKVPKEYGTRRLAEGTELRGKRILLVEDVVTSGGAILDAASVLRPDGVALAHVICVIERAGSGRDALAERDLHLISLFKQADIEGASAAA